MGISVKQISEMFGKDVFTNKGVYAGRVADVRLNLAKFRIHSVVVDVTRGSFLSGAIGNKKGIAIPYQYVDSVGDVVIIKHLNAPVSEDMPSEQAAIPAPMSMF